MPARLSLCSKLFVHAATFASLQSCLNYSAQKCWPRGRGKGGGGERGKGGVAGTRGWPAALSMQKSYLSVAHQEISQRFKILDMKN